MNITTLQAIKKHCLDCRFGSRKEVVACEDEDCNLYPFRVEDVDEACKMAVAALRAQQTPAKLDRSQWEGCPYCKDARNDHVPYCQYCGRPQTEEAWAELERRVSGGTTD